MRSRKPEDVLNPDYVPVYLAQIAELHKQAADLANTMYLLEKIAKFPFRLFHSRHHTFWWLVTKALYESSLITAWRIAVDSGSGFLTVRHLKNEVLKNVADPQVRAELADELKAIDFENKLENAQNLIREYRNRRLAHFQFNATVPESAAANAVSRPFGQDLELVRDAVEQMINVLGFNTEYKLLLGEYDPTVIHPRHVTHTPDIVLMLDEIARSSEYLGLPETDPQKWEVIRGHLTPGDMQQYNLYRSRFGLTECG